MLVDGGLGSRLWLGCNKTQKKKLETVNSSHTVQLCRLISGLVIFVSHGQEEYFGLLMGRHVSVVVDTSYDVTNCGKMPSE